MNDTKWREISFAFSAFAKGPAWRTRDFLTGYLSAWDHDWFYHVGPDYCSIEWMEIDPKGCNTSDIRNVLQTVGVPYEEADFLKIFAYKKPATR